MLYQEITEKIIKAFYQVYNILGYGFLEKVYENALILELGKQGLYANQQETISVYYCNEKVGEYFADIIVNGVVILELKAAETIDDAHYRQVLNYLKATGKELGLILNFGKKAEFKRVIFTRQSDS